MPGSNACLGHNPADASERGIGDGEVVRVFNARGACFAGVAITDTVRPGVVRLSLAADVGRIVKTTGDGMLIVIASVSRPAVLPRALTGPASRATPGTIHPLIW